MCRENENPNKPLIKTPVPDQRVPFSHPIPERREAPPPDHGIPTPPKKNK
jgi:hypothetical protein